MAGLPSGTVTFLFTDLEGSSRLWEEFPDAMQDALARHDEILRDAIVAHDGYVVKTTGDGAHAVARGQRQGVAVAGREPPRLAALAALPHRAHGVDHEARPQPVAVGDARVAGRAASDAPALLVQHRPGGLEDRAAHAAAPRQLGVGGVHDRVHRQQGDVGAQDLQPFVHGRGLYRR